MRRVRAWKGCGVLPRPEPHPIAHDDSNALADKVPGTFGTTDLTGCDRAKIIDDHTIELVLPVPSGGFLQATSPTTFVILAPENYGLRSRNAGVAS